MPTVDSSTVFATGTNGATQPDSLTLGNNSLWAEYGNGAASDGSSGSSTIVQYSLDGSVLQTLSIPGSADGLKVDPNTGVVFALQNQDGNSTLSLIDPASGQVSAPLSYANPSATRGYDDIAFVNGQVYLSYTNPTGAGDPVVQRLLNGDMPIGSLVTANILAYGATGTNIVTGQTGQPIPLNDPDSLKSTPNGDLVLTSEADKTFTIISRAGTAAQSERFVAPQNLPTGSTLDDVIIPDSSSGTFYVSNSGTNQIEAYHVSGLNTGDAYASVGTEIVQVDLQTGATTPVVVGLSSSHGLAFQADAVTGPTVQSTSIFALGSEVGDATQPDSVTMGDGSIWVEYGNGADSTGKLPNAGSSTIVQYDPQGRIENTLTLPGSIDGLKYDPTTGNVWALQNQDANSSLYLIDPHTGTAGAALSYAPPYVYGADSARGYDDVAFDGDKVFLSYTNPIKVGDPVVQQLKQGNAPTDQLQTTSILRLGDTGTNLVTGQANQPLPVADPDSLKTLSDGSLVLTSDHDASLTIISNPGTAQQTASFVSLPPGSSGLDDAIIPTSTSGTFYVSNLGANNVLKVAVAGLNTSDIYESVGSSNAVDQIDPRTGAITPIITGLNSPHGLMFLPGDGSAASAAASSFSDTLMGLAPYLAQDLLPGSGSGSGGAAGPSLFAPALSTQVSSMPLPADASMPAPVSLTQSV
jgi:hypothetical protein